MLCKFESLIFLQFFVCFMVFEITQIYRFCFSLFSDSCSISSADLGIPKLRDQCLGNHITLKFNYFSLFKTSSHTQNSNLRFELLFFFLSVNFNTLIMFVLYSEVVDFKPEMVSLKQKKLNFCHGTVFSLRKTDKEKKWINISMRCTDNKI